MVTFDAAAQHSADLGARRQNLKSIGSSVAKLAPGVAASAVVMQGGFMGAEYLGQGLLALQGISGASPISGIPVAILLGMAIKNTVGVPSQLEDGIKFATKPVLQAGIVCVGAKLSAVDLVTTGLVGLPAVVTSIGVGLTFIPWLGNKMGLPAKMSSLIAAGTSICGVTAITALSPAIKASQQDTSFAVANVVAFGTIGMLVYPYVAHAIIPSSHAIGIALGLSVHDTSQVIGCALSYSTVFGDEEVLKVATVTKLTRNLFLAGVIPGLTYMTARSESQLAAAAAAKENPGAAATLEAPSSLVPSFAEVKKYFPGFVAGFVGMSALRTVGDMTLASDTAAAFGVFDADTWKTLTKFVGNELGSHYLLGTAMAGVGLSTSASALRGVGIKPFIVGLAGAGAVGATGFSTALILHHVFHLA
ncbi:Hypothetical Protein FCC1311_010922 [Hondaea fermentalgiana]|uniref:Uncharacterized protein n=1 Tax=Hondaea fermentalgiana TaxID=2315210 RepID=A0A2R5GB08_9STRA|nr:Hypothetical Protein FCC1311_010922 [Hondaea fermentalgiana]|eukprot:GBG24874.1 Hypothetical Protein FCC1311_010922 [Hondaea fermentalgiana]